jgi:hypothetical protein
MFSICVIENQLIDEYLSILNDRCLWLKERDLDMWKNQNLKKSAMIQKYKNPIFYGAFENKVLIGGFILIEEDKRYWPNNLNDKAYYFHKFVVSLRYGGLGYSHKILGWVKDYGSKKKKEYIRLDYQKQRDYLRKMYLGHGFIDKDEIIQDDGSILVLGEYKIG